MKNKFKEIAEKLAQLGVVEYQYNGKDGKLRLRDKDKKVVAYSDCEAIMSFASTNNSYRWGLLGGPTVKQPKDVPGMKMDVTEEEAREVATKVAYEGDYEYMFAGTMMTLTIYLACKNLRFGDDNLGEILIPWHPVSGDMNKHRDFIMSVIDKVNEAVAKKIS